MKVATGTLIALKESTEALILAGQEDSSSDLFQAQLRKVENILALLKVSGVSSASIQTCQVPVPPSANKLTATVYRGRGRSTRVKTKEQKEYLIRASNALRLALRPVEAYPVHVSLSVVGGKDFPTSRDLDNAWKAVLDSVVEAGIIKDDSRQYVTKETIEFIDSEGPSACFFEIAEPVIK